MSSDHRGDHGEPVAVGSYDTEGEAEVAQAKLRAFGIASGIGDPIEGGTVPSEGAGGVVLQVRRTDAAKATQILADVPDGAPPAPNP